MTLSIAEPPSMSKALAEGPYSTILRLAVDIHATRHKRPTTTQATNCWIA